MLKRLLCIVVVCVFGLQVGYASEGGEDEVVLPIVQPVPPKAEDRKVENYVYSEILQDRSPEAQALIDSCWSGNEKKVDSIDATEMRRGVMDTSQCLRKEIKMNLEKLSDPIYIADIETKLVRLEDAFVEIFWIVANGSKTCAPECEFLPNVVPYKSLIKYYESILTDIVDRRNKYNL